MPTNYQVRAAAVLELRKRQGISVPHRNKQGQKVAIARERFINDVYSKGGKPALERIKKYGCNEDELPIHFYPWFLEYVEAIADFRIAHTLTTGASQIGKTLGHTLVNCDTIIHGKCQTAWFYADSGSLDLNVPDQFRPVVEQWVKNVEELTSERFNRKNDRLINERYQVEGVGGIFSFASTSKPAPRRAGKAMAGSKGVSFKADMVFYEEKSQWETNVDFSSRMGASCLPSHPTRELGTPGSGQGIEAGMQDCDHYFYPHYECQSCGAIAPLSPKGCLLKPFKVKDASGQQKDVYLSPSGRPVEWHHTDKREPVASAYFGCSSCGEEIPDETRYNARFRCRQTKIWLRDFLDTLPPGVAKRRLKVAIHLSPLIRETKFSLSTALIDEGITCGNPDDYQQQKLGEPSETSQGSLTLEILKRSLYAPSPKGTPSVTLAGVDQGRGQHWLWIADFYCPENYQSMPVEQVIEQTVQSVRFAGDIIKPAIAGRLQEYNVEFGLIDNEPDRTDAAELARQTCLKLADQKDTMVSDTKLIKVSTGGVDHDCWAIANSKFLKQVLNTFLLTDADGYPLQRLPSDWDMWLSNPSEISPLRHLSGPSYDPNTGRWTRGNGGIDDLYYACMFTQASFYLWLMNQPPPYVPPMFSYRN